MNDKKVPARTKRGALKIYLGAAPGSGKTCAMLNEAHGLVLAGRDVVIGIVEDLGANSLGRCVMALRPSRGATLPGYPPENSILQPSSRASRKPFWSMNLPIPIRAVRNTLSAGRT